MIDPLRHMSLGKRVLGAVWILNILLVLAVLVFALR
jgi:hypothetical protein